MFGLHKSWDNRKARRLSAINLRTWTRRVQWLIDGSLVKLKFWDESGYSEWLFLSDKDAQTAYDRFRAGQTIRECVSILGSPPPKHLASRQQTREEES